jgi:alpha-N-arabinofuranosidase
MSSIAATAGPLEVVTSSPFLPRAGGAVGDTRVAVLLVDTERVIASIDERIYGHFLEHINHSVVDGLYAEQIRGCGFEGKDFETYWESFSDRGRVENADVDFRNGKKSVRLHVEGGRAGIKQDRVYVVAGQKYDGSVWVRREAGSPQLMLRVVGSKGEPIASVPLVPKGSGWEEIGYSFSSAVRDTQASVELAAAGTGTLLVDYFSMMRADARRDGMLRPDLLQALRDLAPPFIRWPGGSFASTYKWEGRHRPARIAPIHPQHVLGRLLGLLRLRNGRVFGTLPEAEQRALDRAAGARRRLRAGSVRHGLGPLPE